MVGLTGLEPVTPALSRRCSNQLSYRPALESSKIRSSKLSDVRIEPPSTETDEAIRIRRTRNPDIKLLKSGGKRIRTADIQLAKLALYQLSYAPERKRKEIEVKTNWHAARTTSS